MENIEPLNILVDILDELGRLSNTAAWTAQHYVLQEISLLMSNQSKDEEQLKVVSEKEFLKAQAISEQIADRLCTVTKELTSCKKRLERFRRNSGL